jgi:hypothetical protein
MNIDEKKLIQAAILVAALGVVILALTYLLPIVAILVALVIIGGAIYALYLFLTGQLKK